MANLNYPTPHAPSHEPGGLDPLDVDAAAGMGSLRTLGTGAQQAVAGNDSRLFDARTPTPHAASHGPAGSDSLAAFYAQVGAAPAGHHVSHEPGGSDPLAVDAGAAVGSLRTLGAGAQQATAGNDARLSNARTPTVHAPSHLPGGTDPLTPPAYPPIPTLHVAGNYYPAQHITSGTLAPAQGDMRLVPFWVPRPGTYDRIVVEMTSVGEAGSVVRLGIYGADQETGIPLQANPILDAGTVQTATVTGAKEINITQALPAGLVWLAAVNQLCPTTPATLRTTSPYGQPLTANTIAAFMGSGGVWVKAGVTGALPAWNLTSAAAQTQVAKMYLRKA